MALQVHSTKASKASCDVSVKAQEKGFLFPWCETANVTQRFPACFPQGVRESHPLDNIIVQLPDPSSCPVAISPTWVIGGWEWKYVQLAPGHVFKIEDVGPDARIFMKLFSGTVLDVNENGVQNEDGHWETFVVTPPITERDLQLNNGLKEIKAGHEGAVFSFMRVPLELLRTPITSMSEGPVLNISGPHSDLLKWTPFSKNYEIAGEQPNFLTGVEFWNLAGIKLDDHEGKHITYNQWWTAREDFLSDAGYHNQHAHSHKNTTFGELHMVMYSAAPSNGLIVQLPHTINVNTEPAPAKIPIPDPAKVPEGLTYFYNQRNNKYVQLTIPLPPGYIHGPLWSIDKETGKPTYDCNGAVRYPWHGLVLGPIGPNNKFHTPFRYTMWVAYEHPIRFVTVPTSMLQYVTNAYLEYKIDWEPLWCNGPVGDEPGVNNYQIPAK